MKEESHRGAVDPTLDDLRDLSRASFRAQNAGFLAMAGTLPILALVAWLQAWPVAFGGCAIAGGLFVNYAYRAGAERGLFRKVFRRMQEEKKAARRLGIGAPSTQAEVDARFKA